MQTELSQALDLLLRTPPLAYAFIQGSEKYPMVTGAVYFYPLWSGTFVMAEIVGLPMKTENCVEAFFGFHIHEGASCTGTGEDFFADTGGHYNPHSCPHPSHAGDLPPLLGNRGYALSFFYTERFLPLDLAGHTVIVHDKPDDFHSQPSGNSGEKIACGVIYTNDISIS